MSGQHWSGAEMATRTVAQNQKNRAEAENNVREQTERLRRDTQKRIDEDIAGLRESQAEVDRLEKSTGLKTGGSTNNKKKAPKKTNKTENEIDLEKAKEISEGLMRRIIDMQLEAEQARINAMKDGAEKRRAQAELDYKRELEEIKRFGIDKKDEYVSQAAAEAKARGKKFDAKKFMESNADYLTYSELIDKTIEERTQAAYNKLAKFDEDLAKKQRTDMREWLKEFGDIEQKRLAIAEEFDEKIAQAETSGARLALISQKRSAKSVCGWM